MKLLANYKNGNYTVLLYENGTKIRMNKLDNLTPAFAESIDISISTVCDGGCQYCYLNCTPQGKHANLHHPVLETLHAGTELALNANDMSNPDLEDFLVRMKEKGVICNLTINQKHLNKHIDTILDWQERHLVWGVGVSLVDSSDKTLIENMNKIKNSVLHVIDGLFTKQDIENLKDKNIKLLMLGYKIVGRGVEYYNQHKDEIEANIAYLRENLYPNHRKQFNGVGFDTLSTEHLDIRHQVSDENWQLHFMGEEGSYTYYLDLVNEKFAVSSMETEQFDMLDNVDDMFNFVREKQNIRYK